MSENPHARLIMHNKGKSKFTSAHTPWVLFYYQICSDRLDARAKEKYYKTSGRPIVKDKLKYFLKEFDSSKE